MRHHINREILRGACFVAATIFMMILKDLTIGMDKSWEAGYLIGAVFSPLLIYIMCFNRKEIKC